MKHPYALLISTLALLISGCSKDNQVSTYTIPKEESKAAVPTAPSQAASPAPATTPPAQPKGQMQALPGMAEQSKSFQTPVMTAPAHWEAQPLGSMRKGSWKIKGEGGATADVSVIAFPGDVGGDLANVNRWRSQVGLGAVDEAKLQTILKPIKVGDLDAKFLNLTNADTGKAVLGVILPKDGSTWFFKAIGSADLLNQEENHFKQLAENTKFQ